MTPPTDPETAAPGTAPTNADDATRQYVTTRRKLIAGTTGIVATSLAGCMGGTSQGTGTETTMSENGSGDTDSAPHPDIDVLNYALTLEHLEHAFYRDGLEKYVEDEISNASVLDPFGEKVRMEVPSRLEKIRDHEKAHVNTLAKVIEQLGGTPVDEASYKFGHENPSGLLKTAKALENTGVAAYKGAAPDVKKNKILGSALAVHSVEARHASFLNFLNRSSPFPKAFGEAKTMEEVLEIAKQFIESDMGGDSSNSSQSEPEAERKQSDDTSDVDVLNYALTLEHLEHAFYRDGLKKYNDDQIVNASALDGFSEEVRSSVPDRLAKIRDHEKAHVDTIKSTVSKLEGTPVEEASYDFGYGNPSEFLGVAKALENTGVAAYAGAAPTIKNDDVFTAAAAIHDVEARHASFLNELNSESPFPKAFDEAKSMEEVKEIAGQFIEDS